MSSKHYIACLIKMNTSCDKTSGKSARSAIKHNTQSLSSLKFLTLTLSAPQGTDPKVRLTGTSDRVVVMDRSEYGDCVILSVAELAHSLDFGMDRVVEAPNNLTQRCLVVVAAFINDALP